MVEKVAEGAVNKGESVEMYYLRNLDINNCLGCDVCYNKKVPCVQKDDMKELSEKLAKSEGVILGSPNYFKNVSALMKKFMDRTNALVAVEALKGKKAAVVCVGGQPLTNTEHCLNVMEEFVRDHDMELVGSVIAKADAPKEIIGSKAIEDECVKLGEKLV